MRLLNYFKNYKNNNLKINLMKSSNSNPTILITGGAGFIGSNTCDLLLNQNFNLIVIDNLSTGSLENIKYIKNKIIFIILQ